MQLTNGHGSYQMGLQLRDAALDLVWPWQWEQRHHIPELEPLRIILHGVTVPFPAPGRYDLALLADGDDVASYTIQVRPAERK